MQARMYLPTFFIRNVRRSLAPALEGRSYSSKHVSPVGEDFEQIGVSG